jgi:hypothetical protein
VIGSRCGNTPGAAKEYYSSYESGRFLEVKEMAVETSKLVSVSVSFDPHFRSKIERVLFKEDNKT